MVVSRGRRPLVAAVVALGSLTGVLVGGSPAGASGPATVTFSAPGDQSWTVPAGVTSVTLSLAGGQGGLAYTRPSNVPGGQGAEVGATVAVSPGDVLAVTVAGAGHDSDTNSGGFGGGGNGAYRQGGGGGGASRVSVGNTLVAVAAGGGGGAVDSGDGGASSAPGTGSSGRAGGGGGGATLAAGGGGGAGGDGSTWPSCTSYASGAPGADGTSGRGGDGADGQVAGSHGGGGGGGGYFGGGGGGAGSICESRGIAGSGGGGGGGSSYVDAGASNVSVSQGVRSGDGLVTITFEDSVPPTADPTLTPAPNAAGWNDAPVRVDWGWTDAGAGVDPAACTQQSTAAAEGVLQLVALCSDQAGNTASDSVTVRIDTSDPTASISTPADGASYPVHQQVDAGYSCADSVSGIDTCTGTVPQGAALDTATVGVKAFTVTATDRAGNTSTSTVHYTVTAGPAAAITATAGQGQAATVGTTFATPLAAQVTDADGNPITAATVTWTVTTGSATFPGGQSTATAATDSTGVATAPDLRAGSAGGPITVQASTTGVADPATYQLSAQQPPAITSADAATFTIGRDGHVTITTTGYPVPVISWTGPLPTGISFTDNGNGTATLAGTPAPGTAGTYPLTIDAENGVNDPTQTFTLKILDTTPSPNPNPSSSTELHPQRAAVHRNRRRTAAAARRAPPARRRAHPIRHPTPPKALDQGPCLVPLSRAVRVACLGPQRPRGRRRRASRTGAGRGS